MGCLLDLLLSGGGFVGWLIWVLRFSLGLDFRFELSVLGVSVVGGFLG